MKQYFDFIERYAIAILVLLAAITVFFVLQLGKLTADSNPYLLDESHPARRTILEMRDQFTGTYDAVLVSVHNPQGIFNKNSLDAIYHFTHTSKKMMLANQADADFLAQMAQNYSGEFATLAQQILADGLQQNDMFNANKLAEIASQYPLDFTERAFIRYLPNRLNPIEEMAGMAASENILTDNATLVVRPSLNSPDYDVATVRDEIMGNDMMIGSVVNKAGTISLVVVELGIKQDDAEGQLRAYQVFQDMISSYQANHPEFTDEVHIAGVPIFIAEQKKLIDHDMALLFPIVILIVGAILIAYFRKPLGFVLPMLNVVMCAIWTLGLMALTKVPLDLVTSVLPVFLITICGADAIHIMNEYYEQRRNGLQRKIAMRETMTVMLSPVLLTTVTTVAAFLVSTSTNISSIWSFGVFMAVGLVVAQIISLLLIPAWLSLWGGKIKDASPNAQNNESVGKLGQVLGRWFSQWLPHRYKIIPIFFVSLIGMGYAAINITIEDAGAEYFAKDNPFRQSDEFVNKHLAGTSPGWIEFTGNGPRSVLTQSTVAFIEQLDQFLLSQPNVTYTYSLAEYVRRMFYVLHDMQPDYNRIPKATETFMVEDWETGAMVPESVSGDDLVGQSILMYENGGGADLTNILNSDFSGTVVMFTMNTTRATEYQTLLANLQQWLDTHQPDNLQVKIGGSPVIWSGVLDEIMQGQVKSFVIAMLMVVLVMAIWLRSLRMALLASIPLGVTVVFYYGFMTLADIDLNIGTALISFLVVGIVDYSVHYILRVKHGLQQHQMALDQALIYAVRHSGSSISFNVVLFSFGFIALLFSDFAPIVHLGSLVALALLLSGFMSLFLIALFAPWLMPNKPQAKPVKQAQPEAQLS